MATSSPAHTAVQPNAPVTGHPSPAHPIQLHADAHNALTMALHYLRQPTANVPGAARKTVQALAALRALFVLNTPDAAHTAAQAQQVLREAGHV
jgi:hypothetical protein